MAINVREVRPQAGPQEAFLASQADITIYGGSAGGGKTYGLLLEPLRSVTDNPGMSAVIFRRTTTSIRNPGALWDESLLLYSGIGGHPKDSTLEWTWARGGKVKMAHLEYDKTVYDWHGSQIPLICFDELTEFTPKQFFYMVSRNRSTCGVRPYIRATCNPDAESWVAELIAWWIDQSTGFPIPERSGVIRYFVRVGDDLVWGDKKSDLTLDSLGLPELDAQGKAVELMPKSLTFIPATIYDYPALLRANPEYLANLLSLPTVERERLFKGNWKIKPAAGLYFNRSWCELIETLPAGLAFKRGWDLAATPKTQLNDPDWTCGTKIGKISNDPYYYIAHHEYFREAPGEVKKRLRNVASQDGAACEVHLPQDPGQAGKVQVVDYTHFLDGYPVRFSPERGGGTGEDAKLVRFRPFSAQAQAGFVRVLKGAWNERWFSQLEGFPDGPHDDDVDSTSRAYNAFVVQTSGLIDFYRGEADRLIADKAKADKRKELPTIKGGGVKVRGPANTNVITDAKGRAIYVQADGTFIVEPEHALQLRRSGFRIIRNGERAQ